MARSLRSNWTGQGTAPDEKQMRDNAEKAVRERNDGAFQHLVSLQGFEIKALESDQTHVMQEQARDVKPMHDRQIAGVNARFDRQVREQRRRNNSLLGRISRVFGGHKRQQAQMQRIERNRVREVDDRRSRLERSEGLRQKSLTERAARIERELNQTKERHAVARDEFRQNRERGFELAVRNEMNRQRSQRRGRSL